MTDRLTIHHCRSAGYCLSGVRRKCADLGFDFRALVREGLPLSDLEHVDDVAVRRAVAIAKEESSDGQGQ